MNFKLKTLVAAVVMSVAATSANAAPASGAAATGSSMIFSAWNAAGSYSIDLGTFLNTYLGADTISGSMLSGTNKSQNASNTLTASNTSLTATPADIQLVGFNLSGADVLWNVAGSDNVGRNRLLISQVGTFAGTANSTVGVVAGGVGGYEGLGAAASTTAGTIVLAADPAYANSASWGDTLGGSLSGTANTLAGTSNLVAVWQQSTTVGTLATQAAGFGNLTYLGQNVQASVISVGGNSYLHLATASVAAVPEADTSAMMLAGLGLMGFIARRRNRKEA